MKTTGIKTIIFDYGGVILDIDPQLTMDEFAKLGARKLNEREVDELLNGIVRKFERGIFTPELFRKRIREFLHIPKATDQKIDDAWNALLFDTPAERIEVIEQTKKHYQILLLSNSNEIHYDLFVRDLQLRFGYQEFDSLFDKAYFSFDMHMTKPDLEVFEFVINQHALNPSKTLFIDDTEENIIAAQKLGLRTFYLQKPTRIRDLFKNGKLVAGLDIH